MNEATRLCADCGADISERHHNAKRCLSCAKAEADRVQRERPPRVKRKTKRGTETLPCIVCGAIIVTNAGRQTCSTRCYQWNAKHPGEPIARQRECGGCGAMFDVWHQAARYCSRQCSSAASKRRNRDIRSLYVRRTACLTCGGPMVGKKAGSKYCSVACGADVGDEARAARKRIIAALPERPCAVCHAMLKPRSLRHVTCSRKCSRLWHYRQNRDIYSSRAIAWMKANPARTRETSAAWYAATQDLRRAKANVYFRANRERIIAHQQKRRASKLGNPGSVGVSPRDWMRLINRYRGCCAYCGTLASTIHMEHVIPLSRGGRHAIGNVVPACPRCNLSKHDRLLSEWRYTLSERGRGWLTRQGFHRSSRPTGSPAQALP